jgi:hypothetical protein
VRILMPIWTLRWWAGVSAVSPASSWSGDD